MPVPSCPMVYARYAFRVPYGYECDGNDGLSEREKYFKIHLNRFVLYFENKMQNESNFQFILNFIRRMINDVH